MKNQSIAQVIVRLVQCVDDRSSIPDELRQKSVDAVAELTRPFDDDDAKVLGKFVDDISSVRSPGRKSNDFGEYLPGLN